MKWRHHNVAFTLQAYRRPVDKAHSSVGQQYTVNQAHTRLSHCNAQARLSHCIQARPLTLAVRCGSKSSNDSVSHSLVKRYKVLLRTHLSRVVSRVICLGLNYLDQAYLHVSSNHFTGMHCPRFDGIFIYFLQQSEKIPPCMSRFARPPDKLYYYITTLLPWRLSIDTFATILQ